MTHHPKAYWSPERVRARREAQQRRRATEAEAMAAVQQLLDAGYATAQYKKGNKLTARNLVSITLTDEGMEALRPARAGATAIRIVNYGFAEGLYEWQAPQEAA